MPQMQTIGEDDFESDRMPLLQSPSKFRPEKSKQEAGMRNYFPDVRGSNDGQADPSSPHVSSQLAGTMGAIKLWGMVKKSVQDKSLFETIKDELGHLPTILQKSLTYGNHTRESSKMKRQNSKLWDQSLPVKKVSVYYGPGVTPSAWSAWDRSIGENHLRVKYVIFRNKRWGTTVELDEGSTGAIRYASNDHSRPLFVQQNGLQSPAAAFGAGRLVHDLKNQARPGSLSMNAQQEMYGGWIARVKGSKIVITQATSMHPSEKMHIVLTPESFLFLGEVSSVSNQPMSFKVDVGKISVALDRKTVCEVKSKLDSTDDDSDDDMLERGGLMDKPDALGSLRRALTSHTNKQRTDDEAATEYFSLPVQVRMATIAEAEMKDLVMQQALGHISAEEYEKRVAAVQGAPQFPSSILTRDEALEASMFVDPDNNQHLPASAFHGFEKLSWKQKLKAAKEIQKKLRSAPGSLRNIQPVMLRQQSFQLVQKEEQAEEAEDPSDPPLPDRKRNTQYIELMGGIRSGGVKREMKATLVRIQKEHDAFRGKEVRQLHEECLRCGRPGGVSGSGLCILCISLEKEQQEMGLNDKTTDPATYYGDSRALRGFDGFEEYVNVPLRKDQKFLNKRSEAFVSTPLDTHRQALTDMGDLFVSPMPQELLSRRSPEYAPEGAEDSPEDAPSEAMSSKEFLRLCRNNRLHEVRDALLANLNFAQDRDELGNTGLLIAAQQGYKRLCQLLIHANSNVNSQNKHGNTVLHYCSRYGFHQLWNYFRKKGADDSLTNDRGLTCFEIEVQLKSHKASKEDFDE